MDSDAVPCPVETFLLSSPVEVAVYVHWLSSARPYPPSRDYLYLRGTDEHRTRRAGTAPPTAEEADYLHSIGLWCLFFAQKKELSFVCIPGWDDLPMATSWAGKTNVYYMGCINGYTIYNGCFSIGTANFTCRLKHSEGDGPTDRAVTENTSRASLMPIVGAKTNLSCIPTSLDEGNMPRECDHIFLDLQSTHTLLKRRFCAMVSSSHTIDKAFSVPGADGEMNMISVDCITRYWTERSFLAIKKHITSMCGSKLPLLAYLVINAAVVTDEANWINELWTERGIYLSEKIAQICERYDTRISAAVDKYITAI